jgi:hypothetical protein
MPTARRRARRSQNNWTSGPVARELLKRIAFTTSSLHVPDSPAHEDGRIRRRNLPDELMYVLHDRTLADDGYTRGRVILFQTCLLQLPHQAVDRRGAFRRRLRSGHSTREGGVHGYIRAIYLHFGPDGARILAG